MLGRNTQTAVSHTMCRGHRMYTTDAWRMRCVLGPMWLTWSDASWPDRKTSILFVLNAKHWEIATPD